METTSDSRKGPGRESAVDSPRNDSYATAMESDGRNATPLSSATVSTGSRPWPSSWLPPLMRPKTVQALDSSDERHSSRYSSMFRRNESRASNPSVRVGPNSAVARRSRRQLRTPPSTGRDGSLERKSAKRERFLSIDGNLGSSCFTLRSDPGSGDCLSIYLSTPTTELEVRSSKSNAHRRSEWESKPRGNEIGSRGAASQCSDWSRNREEWDNACPDVDELSATGVCDRVRGPCDASGSYYHNQFSLPLNVPNDNKTNELSERSSFFRDSPFGGRLRSLVRGSGKCQQREAKRNKLRQSDERRRFSSEAAVSCERCHALRATKTRIGNEYVLPDNQPNVQPPIPHQTKGTANNLFREAKHKESARYEDMKQSMHQPKATANNLSRETRHDESARYADMKQLTYKMSFPCQNEGNSFHRLASDDLYGPRLAPVNFSSMPHKPAPEPKLPLPICKNQKGGSELINRKLFCKRKSQGETIDCRVNIMNNENSARSSELEMEATFQQRGRGGDDGYVAAWECGATPERRNEDERLTSGEMEREASGQTKENWFCRRQESVRCLGLSRPTDSLGPGDRYLGNWSDPEGPPIERPHIERPPAVRPLPGKISNEKVAASGPLKKSSKLYPEVDELVGESPDVELPTSYHGRRRLSSSLHEVIPFYEEIDCPRKGDVTPMQRKKKKTGMETGGKGNSLGRRFLNLMERLRRSVSKRKKSTGDD